MRQNNWTKDRGMYGGRSCTSVVCPYRCPCPAALCPDPTRRRVSLRGANAGGPAREGAAALLDVARGRGAGGGEARSCSVALERRGRERGGAQGFKIYRREGARWRGGGATAAVSWRRTAPAMACGSRAPILSGTTQGWAGAVGWAWGRPSRRGKPFFFNKFFFSEN